MAYGDTANSRYQWTVLIDELNYARTKGGTTCMGPQSKRACPISNNANKTIKDATVVKAYVKKVGSLIKGLDCILSTVNCALLHVYSELNTHTW